MQKILTAAAIAVSLSVSSAFAGSCPIKMHAIDDALKSASGLSAEQMSKVKALREKGEAEHKAGKHAESVATLSEAMAILGIK